MGTKWVKQGTAVTIKFGPFVDQSDGATPETGITLTSTNLRLSKNGGDFASKSTGATAHDEFGWYNLALSTTDVDTLGSLQIACDTTEALPVWDNVSVVTTNVWDSIFGSDNLDVNSVEVTDTGLTITKLGGLSTTARAQITTAVQINGGLSLTKLGGISTSCLAQITSGVRDDITIEKTGSYTLKDALSIALAVLAGRTTDSGAKFLTPDGTATRVTATVNASNERTSMTLDPSS